MATHNLRDRSILMMLRDTGVRVSELVSLRLEWLDLPNRRTFVKSAKVKYLRTCPSCRYKSGRQSKFCPRCGVDITAIDAVPETGVSRRRIVSFVPQTAGYLSNYLQRRGGHSDWVFPSPQDPLKHLTPRMVGYITKKAAESVGLGGKILDHPDFDMKHGVSPHRFRNAMAIQELRKHPDLEGIRVIAHQLGHKSTETTLNSYIKVISQEAAS